MLDLFTAAKYGEMAIAAFNGSAGSAVKYKITKPSGTDKVLYSIRCTKACRIRQGAYDVTAASATTASYLAPNVHYPLCIESDEDKYISIIGDTTDAGSLEIAICSSVMDWSMGPAGIGDSLAYAGGTVTLTDAAAYFQAADVGKTVRISGAGTAGNNGDFTILTVPGATQCTFANASGGNETSSFIYSVQ